MSNAQTLTMEPNTVNDSPEKPKKYHRKGYGIPQNEDPVKQVEQLKLQSPKDLPEEVEQWLEGQEPLSNKQQPSSEYIIPNEDAEDAKT